MHLRVWGGYPNVYDMKWSYSAQIVLVRADFKPLLILKQAAVSQNMPSVTEPLS